MYMKMVRMLPDLLFFYCSTNVQQTSTVDDDIQLFSQMQQQWLGSQNLSPSNLWIHSHCCLIPLLHIRRFNYNSVMIV